MGSYNIVDYNNFIFKKYMKYKNKIDYYKDKWDDVILDIIRDTISDIVYFGYITFANGVIVVDDYGSWRKNVYNEYKTNRREKSMQYNYDFLLKLKEKFAEISNRLGIIYFKIKGLESDDCVYLWSTFLYKLGKNVIILSTDSDFNQLLNVNKNNFISILSYRKINNGDIFVNKNGNNNGNNKNKSHLVLTVVKGFKDVYLYNDKDSDSTVNSLSVLEGNIKWDDFKERFIKNLKRFNVIIKEEDKNRDLLRKIMCGDYSDNIKSIWYGKYKNKRMRFNIDDFNRFYELLNLRYSSFTVDDILNNREILEDLACMLEDRKKVSNINIDDIYKNIMLNNKLINLRNIPNEYIKEFMDYVNSNRNNIFGRFKLKDVSDWVNSSYKFNNIL